MVKTNHLPDADRVSVLAALITIAYTLTRFIDIPVRELALQLPGFYISLRVDINTIVPPLVAALTAAGAAWLMSDHPAIQGRVTLRYGLVPALTAWVLGYPLSQIPFGFQWWLALFAGVGLLVMILIAEYVVIDPNDVRYPLAGAGLLAVSFALFMALAVMLRTAEVRLYGVLPLAGIGAGLVSLRAINLRSHGEWMVIEAGIVALVIGQITAALHYWPLSPIGFGLALLGPTYALTSLISNLLESGSVRQSVAEPLFALAIIWGAAIWIH